MEQELLEKLPELLLPWYAANARSLPWREDREPYHIWLSEIMLQQTRVEAVKDYYRRFLAALPDIPALAAADEGQVNKLWEGLGYYSRARNLHRAAKEIVACFGGQFPQAYEQIRALPGIGDYTAGAIGSIAFELPTPAVDGNVLRVISRVKASSECVSDPKVKQKIRAELAEVYPQGSCGVFTQSLMEVGATVCVPNGAPRCGQCPLGGICRARAENIQTQLPVKAQKRQRRQEKKTVLVLCCDGNIALLKRPETGLLAGLWQLPDVPGHCSAEEAVHQAQLWGTAPRELLKRTERTHIFTHVEWDMVCYFIRCADMPERFVWADSAQLAAEYSVPTAYRQFLDADTPT